MKKLLALLLAACMLISVSAVFAEDAGADIPLVVATSTLSQKFSPYFADTAYDQEVVARTQINMMTTDRVGGIIYNGIEGETISYNGTDYTYYGTGDLAVNYDDASDITTYSYKMRQDLKFSDGEPVTIDDVIFNYYVFLDPAYNGSTTLSSYDIVGLQAYRNQVPEANVEEVAAIADAVKTAFAANGSEYKVTADDKFTQEMFDKYAADTAALWKEDLQGIVDVVYENYGPDYAEQITGKSFEEVGQSDSLKILLGGNLWGFPVEGDNLTIDDLYAVAFAKYGGSFDAYLAAGESATGTTADAINNELMAAAKVAAGVDPDASVPNITGIKRVDDYTLEVQVHGFSAPAVYSILGLQIAPMHYYGDPAQYDYENNKFGHPFGDLSLIQSKNDAPMGAGPYKFVKYDNRVAYYEANENYFLGAPKIKSFQYKETNSAEVATAVQTGTADGGEMTGNKSNFEMLRSFNSNGEVTGDVVTTYSVANLGYGYIGMNADTMNVGGDPGSEASKNLRKGFATILAVYRDTAIDSYYGDAAAVINYPISSTSWAAPQATDEGYRVAFSVTVDGDPIYTANMSAEEKYEAAKQAAIGYFKAAGYTFDDATGKFTAAPEGASLSYEAIIPGDGTGDHPSFAILTDARAALETIGIELKINDPADSNVLWDALDAGTQNIWCAAWGSTIDPDMYQVYHSSNIVGKGGSDSNHYHIQSPKLDELILNARQSSDQAYRKEVYRDALNEIMDWAVEIPAYQRQNIVIASTERVNIGTVTPDVTTYWGWLSEVHLMEMNATK